MKLAVFFIIFLIRKGTVCILSSLAFIFLMKSYVDFGLVQEGIEFRRQAEKSAEA